MQEKSNNSWLDHGGWLLAAAILLFVLHGVFDHAAFGLSACTAFLAGWHERVRRWHWLRGDYVWRCLFGFLLTSSMFVAILLLAYFALGGLTAWTAVVVTVLGIGGFLFLPIGDAVAPNIHKEFEIGAFWLTLSIVSSVLALVMVFLVRTSDPVVSPWTYLPVAIFFLYFFAVLSLMMAGRHRDDDAVIAVGSLFMLLSTIVSAIVYGVGFGFDPFVHRAAETALLVEGSIQPLQILYSGQYASVVALTHLTHLPLEIIDIWMVPLLAALLLPAGVMLGLEKGWKLSRSDARTWWTMVLLIPFMLLTFTVPFTFSYVFFLVLIFLLPAVKGPVPQGILLASSGLLLFFHPLLALPCFLLIFGWILYQRKPGLAVGFTLGSVALSVPALFVVYQWQQGQAIAFSNIWQRFGVFLNLFRNPFFDPYPDIPFHLQLLYDIRFWLPVIVAVAGAVILVVLWKRLRTVAPIYLGFAAGLMLCLLILSTTFEFKDIIVHEQAEFALRLLQVWYLIPLPFLVLGILSATKEQGRSLVIFFTAVLVTVSWHFSYPQYNAHFPYFSPSVSASDLEAVRLIEERAAGMEHIVLSHQMTSAAALQELGFAHYVSYEGEEVLWYAIPTGGPVYKFYTGIIYQEAHPDVTDELFVRTSVERIYFVLHDYMSQGPEFVQALQDSADESFTIEDGSITIFEFK